MRVLLTGAAGFIGTRIGAQLSAAGHEVVGVDVMLPAAHGDGAQPPPDVRLRVATPPSMRRWARRSAPTKE